MRLNPAPIGALSPAVPKLIRLQSLILNSSRWPAATKASTWARVLPFYSRHRKRPSVTTNTTATAEVWIHPLLELVPTDGLFPA